MKGCRKRTKAMNAIECEIDRVEFDMRDRMKERGVSLGAADPALPQRLG